MIRIFEFRENFLLNFDILNFLFTFFLTLQFVCCWMKNLLTSVHNFSFLTKKLVKFTTYDLTLTTLIPHKDRLRLWHKQVEHTNFDHGSESNPVFLEFRAVSLLKKRQGMSHRCILCKLYQFRLANKIISVVHRK